MTVLPIPSAAVDEALFTDDGEQAMIIDMMGMGAPDKLEDARKIMQAAISAALQAGGRGDRELHRWGWVSTDNARAKIEFTNLQHVADSWMKDPGRIVQECHCKEPTPPQPPVAEGVGAKIAEALYAWMADVETGCGSLLSAAVLCDYAGKRGLINEMARRIDEMTDSDKVAD